jgi:hypothetical protein
VIQGEHPLKLRYWQWMVLAVCSVVSVGVLYRGHQVTEGRMAFERLGCPSCHSAGGAPSLEHVGRKYDRATFVKFVSNPEPIYARRGHQPLNPGYLPMPRLEASPRDVEAISYFLSAQR